MTGAHFGAEGIPLSTSFVPLTRWNRWLFDTCMSTRIMYYALHEVGLQSRTFVQDVGIPYAKAEEFGHWIDDEMNFGYYPLWLCPLRMNASNEERVSSLGGTKWLYAHTNYTKDEFWSIYNRK